MKALEKTVYRSVAVLAFAALGIATTIATGGGGGGSNLAPPIVDDGPSLAITVDNGEAISAAVVTGAMLMFDVGEATGDPLLTAAAEGTPMLQKPRIPSPRDEAPFKDLVEFCSAGGSITLSGDVADPNMLSVGDTISAVFDNCDDNDGYVIDGALELTVAAIQGDPLTGVFLVTLDLVLTDLGVTDGSGTVMTDGDLSMTLDSLGFPVVVMVLTGDELTVSDANLTVTVEDYDHTLEIDTGLDPQTIVAEVFGRLRSTALGGTVDYETTTPIRASGDDPPHTGELLISGADDSEVRVVIVSAALVRLEIDEEGDGVVDEYVDTTWDALSGEASN